MQPLTAMTDSALLGPGEGRSSNIFNGQTDISDNADVDYRRLVKDGLDRDDAALRCLVDAMRPVVRTRVLRALRRRQAGARGRDVRQDADDLVQDVFAALFAKGAKALRAWEPHRGLSFLGFVGLLAEREVGMRLRTTKRHPWTEDPTSDDVLDGALGSMSTFETYLETRDALARILEQLMRWMTPEGQRYFQLLYVDGQSVQEVAQHAGTSADAVYAWRSRLMKKARALRAASGLPEPTLHLNVGASVG